MPQPGHPAFFHAGQLTPIQTLTYLTGEGSLPRARRGPQFRVSLYG